MRPAIHSRRHRRVNSNHQQGAEQGCAQQREADGGLRGGCHGNYFSPPLSNTAMKAFCGMSTEPIDFIRFLPSF